MGTTQLVILLLVLVCLSMLSGLFDKIIYTMKDPENPLYSRYKFLENRKCLLALLIIAIIADLAIMVDLLYIIYSVGSCVYNKSCEFI